MSNASDIEANAIAAMQAAHDYLANIDPQVRDVTVNVSGYWHCFQGYSENFGDYSLHGLGEKLLTKKARKIQELEIARAEVARLEKQLSGTE